ncbi:MAG TPA: hypothetical protein VMZ30_22640 [Pyrinomonadaceae bacterium]|nr:hypothetical protein [Pyrinomonadaceae bacterium]
MKRTPITLLALLAVASISTLVVWAGNGHFINSFTTAACTSSSSLEVKFKEAGLESGSVETIVLNGQGTATYQCFNKGGHNPAAGNKETVGGPVVASGEFSAAKNGNIIGTLTLSPPGPGDFSCPSGQALVGPTDVSFTDVSISDLDSGATAAVTAAVSCP